MRLRSLCGSSGYLRPDLSARGISRGWRPRVGERGEGEGREHPCVVVCERWRQL